MNIIEAPLRLPLDLQCTQEEFERYFQANRIVLQVEDSYLTVSGTWSGLPEVVCIQRLIALASQCKDLHVRWHQTVAREVFRSPGIFPLLAVLLCLDDVVHTDANGTNELDVGAARKEIYEYRLRADLFSDIQILLCADNRGHGRPKALYSSQSGGIILREEFESIIDLLLSTHKGYGIGDSKAIFFIKAVGTIVAELFENTEIHGRLGPGGKPIARNGLRGLIFKRVKILRSGAWKKLSAQPEAFSMTGAREPTKEVDALEISVFDAGVGFYSAYTRKALDLNVTVSEEWDVVHKCMERHYDKTMADGRPSHRAMGLYEVLRALQLVSGVLEVRSGRIYGFRTFVPGELKFQLEANESQTRPNMPKPVLLDRNRQFVTVPTQHERISGSSVRVVIPLL